MYFIGNYSISCVKSLHMEKDTSCTLLSGEDDLLDVTDYLQNMEKTHIYNLGLVLGLRQIKVKDMMDSPTFRDDVITAWLRKEDQVSEKGEPSWTVLVNALKHPRVGQIGIANNIALEVCYFVGVNLDATTSSGKCLNLFL